MTTDGREIGTVRLVNVEDEMRSSYLDYAMSVITARALPDVRDGLKPVQRRILYSMHENGLRSNVPYRKSATTVGDVLGKYHPHGDAAVYDALVRMAQDFSMRHPLIDGQGNFGSIDADPAAAMRYTEARMTALAEQMLADIEKNTVDFGPNYDNSREQPLVLPSKVPNLLLNGASGIAVGMATTIPPHHLGELIDALIHLIDHPDATVEDLCKIVAGPDFPTAGIILGREGIKSAYSTGHGRIVVQARAHVEEMPRGGRFQIVVTELPYQVNKAALIEKMADLVKSKREGLDGITEIRDESDRQGMRIVIELRRDCQPRMVLNNLYKHTAMRQSFSVNMLALVNGQPRVLTLKLCLQHFLTFRREVLRRRTEHDLARAREREHILQGLKIALDNLDAIIDTIRRSQSAETARTNLIRGFQLTEPQAQAILDMQLRRLAALERKKILEELTEIQKTIKGFEDLLAHPEKIDRIIKDELKQLKEKFSDQRRTQIIDANPGEFSEEDLIPNQDVVVTVSSRGYVKRVPVDTYRSQRRGGKGVTGMGTREADYVQHLLVAQTHDSIMFFTNRGRVFQVKCHELPDASRQAKGLPVINLISIDPQEQVTAVVQVPSDQDADYLIMGTRRGEVKKTPVRDFASVRSNGLIAMNLEEGDELCWAKRITKGDELIMVSSDGQAIRFFTSDLRAASRTSGGVRGMRLTEKAHVIGMDVVRPDSYLLVITSKGIGKRTLLDEYPIHGRGGGGVKTLNISARTGPLVAARVVDEDQEVMIISASGIVVRTPIKNIPAQGRATQGVNVQKVGNGDSVAGIAAINGRGEELVAAGAERLARR